MLITFEGPEGSGKTTQIALLKAYLARQGYSVVTTREPGGTDISEQIRTVIQNHKNTALTPEAEILLFSASRAQLVSEVIKPALDAGQIILSDRFYDSTYAYQGYGHGLDLDVLRTVTRFVTQGIRPDLTLYIDISPEEGLRRRQADSDAEWNRMDALALSFHQRVHEGYAALIAQEPERWVELDGSQPAEAVHHQIIEAVMPRLKLTI